LKRIVQGHFDPGRDTNLTVTFMSFGYKFALPRESDIVMDVRFLKNPHWDETLRPLTGKDASVAAFIGQDPEVSGFMTRFKALLEPLLDRYADEGKSY